MTPPSDDTNAAMIEYWNEDGGKRFIQNQERLDAQIGPLGSVVIERAAVTAGEAILDVGCGCGQSSLQLALQAGSEGRVLGVDVSAPMLEVARRRAEQAGLAQLSFEQADAQTASLPDESFDCIYSRFGVMFFDDPVAAFANLRGALKPGGRVCFVCWQPLPKNPWMLVPMMAAAKVLPMPAPPEPGAPGPFAFGDDARVRDILERAGFESIATESYESSLALGGPGDLDDAVDLILQIGPVARILEEGDPSLRPAAAKAVREAVEPHATAKGVELGAAVWLVSARRS